MNLHRDTNEGDALAHAPYRNLSAGQADLAPAGGSHFPTDDSVHAVDEVTARLPVAQ